MHFSSFIFTTLIALTSALPAPPAPPAPRAPEPPTNTTLRLGRRNLLLPDSCTYTDPSGKVYPDLIPDLKRGLLEVTQLIEGALAHPPETNSWFENFFDKAEYQKFRDILIASYSFTEDAEFFDTIHIDCAAASGHPRDCVGQKEWDGGERIAVTDVENDIIYICPAAWKGDKNGKSVTRLFGAIQGQDDDGDGVLDEAFTDGYCPDRDGERSTENRFTLYDYQFFATTLLREIAHTGSAIRKVPGSDLKHRDKDLHAQIEKYGWAATMAYWERVCGYRIPMPEEKDVALTEYLGTTSELAKLLMPYDFDFEVDTGNGA